MPDTPEIKPVGATDVSLTEVDVRENLGALMLSLWQMSKQIKVMQADIDKLEAKEAV